MAPELGIAVENALAAIVMPDEQAHRPPQRFEAARKAATAPFQPPQIGPDVCIDPLARIGFLLAVGDDVFAPAPIGVGGYNSSLYTLRSSAQYRSAAGKLSA
jgi:hypothetical protein